MAGSEFGTIFRVTTWGESHGKAIGAVVDGCPAGLDIPMLLAAYNAFRLSSSEAERIEALPADKQPSACVGCGQCVKACPQGINVPAHLKAFADGLARRSR